MSFSLNLKDNPALLTDFCQFGMAYGAMGGDIASSTACFDLVYRDIPDGGGFIVSAGLSQLIDYLRNLKFTDEDIEYLRSTQGFGEDFLDYLKNFKFTCDVWAVPEGTPVFPFEPVITVRGPLAEAQFIEAALLMIINHQSLVATKASRIVRAADGREVYEFGTKRAHGAGSAVYGARAAYIGGCTATSNVLASKEFGIPAFSTMTHSLVQAFDTEYEAFKYYAEQFPNNCVLLVDTYTFFE